MLDYIVDIFDKNHPDRKNFSCNEEALETYFKEKISQDIKKYLCSAYVIYSSDKSKILGYFTLSQHSVKRDSSANNKGTYKHIPATLLGRFAIHQDYCGQGIGTKVLTNDIFQKHKELSIKIGSTALMLEPKENSRKFYNKLNCFKKYESVDEDQDLLFITTQNINKLKFQ